MKRQKSTLQNVTLQEVGENIRFARTLKALTQEDLAIQLDVTSQQISKYEKGTNAPSFDKLQQLSNALEIPINELLSNSIPVSEHPFFTNTLNKSRTTVPEAEILELISNFSSIKKASARKTILEMVKLVNVRCKKK